MIRIDGGCCCQLFARRLASEADARRSTSSRVARTSLSRTDEANRCYHRPKRCYLSVERRQLAVQLAQLSSSSSGSSGNICLAELSLSRARISRGLLKSGTGDNSIVRWLALCLTAVTVRA